MASPSNPINPAPPPAARSPGWYHAQLLPGMVLAVSLAVTYQLWQNAQRDTVQVLQTKFDYQVSDTVDEINKRMMAYRQVMRGVDGLFAHADLVKRKEFHDYIARLRLKENYPGIQSIRFIPLIPQAEKGRHIAAIRKEGFPAYSVWPDGQRDNYAPVIYAEPPDERNPQVFGYDMLSDNAYPRPGDSGIAPRRTAMEQARDSGNIAISGKIKLVFETDQDNQAGFVMFLPVYKYGARHDTIAERRANTIGWVGSVFRAGDLMHGILGEHADIDIEIYDGEEVSDKTAMFDTSLLARHPHPRFRSLQRISIAGHTWTVGVHSLPVFDAQLDKGKLSIIANYGMGLSLLLALLTWLLVHGRTRALQAAAAVERASRKNEMLLHTASDGIYIFDPEGNVVQVNDAFCRMLGYTQHELLGMNVAQWNAQWTKEELLARINALGVSNPVFETLHRHRDGSIVEVEISASKVEIDGRQLIYNSVRDITERKKTEAAFRTIAGTAVTNVGATFFQETTSSLCALLEADCVIVGRLVNENRMQALAMQLDGKMIERYEYALPDTPCENTTHKGYCEYPEQVCQMFPLDKDLVDMGAEAYVGAPTRDKNGRVNGILCAISRRKLVPQPMRKEVIEIIAARAGAELSASRQSRRCAKASNAGLLRWRVPATGYGTGTCRPAKWCTPSATRKCWAFRRMRIGTASAIGPNASIRKICAMR